MEELKEYALEHYDTGGHWVYETYADSDYQEVLDRCGGNILKACKYLKKSWGATTAYAAECGDF